MNLLRPFLGEPTTFREGEIASLLQKGIPQANASLKTDVIDGSLTPDQVEGSRLEGWFLHRAHKTVHPRLQSLRLYLMIQFVNETGIVVDGRDLGRASLRKCHGLAARATAKVSDPGSFVKPLDEA